MNRPKDQHEVAILRGEEIISLLDGRERDIMELVRSAYEAHHKADSSLPHSLFLSFPSQPRNRIIALPAYLGDGFGVAGLKWIASFPDNLEAGLDRASAVIILNSARTGHPEAILEGSVISAKRTAASAAVAAKYLTAGPEVRGVGFVGCGLINFEIARFLLAQFPSLETFTLYDRTPEHAALFAERCRALAPHVEVAVAGSLDEVLAGGRLISFATTALEPFVHSLEACPPGTVVLHISLRDLLPEVILKCVNVVDDVDHVCRARTSVNLAEQLVGNRDFINCALAEITSGAVESPHTPDSVTVFSPFGLGVLDLALAKYVSELARESGVGLALRDFLPPAWRSHDRTTQPTSTKEKA
ncbi:MAG TPA: 2,3-diaminopropionate biosynthesis protein SbnB [Pyrinomonadaceae bacterium]|nr:2,3-diaminopropionate biosynthesis protein SbnB [Pyrinomonadaceae bacterium]